MNKSRKVENLQTFAKVNGYFRWFYPSDEATQVDWNKFAVYGIQKVQNARNEKELMKILLELFNPIASAIQIFETNRSFSGGRKRETLNMKKLITILVFILTGAVALCQKPSGSKRHSVTLNPNSGYMNINELHYGYGFGGTTRPYSKQFFGLTTMHGYQLNIYGLNINRSLLGGIGTGILFYNGGHLFPLYIDLRFVWNSKKISPFILGNSGLLLNFEDLNMKTRIFINGGGGVRLKIDDSLSAIFGTGLFVQMGNSTIRDAFVNLKMGVVFKPR